MDGLKRWVTTCTGGFARTKGTGADAAVRHAARVLKPALIPVRPQTFGRRRGAARRHA
jgi:hypothetical protein